MRKLLVCLGLLAMLSSASACGGRQSRAFTPPSVTIKDGPVFAFQHDTTRVFDLVATGSPSGVIALKSVRNGHVTRLRSCQFEGMQGTGSVALRVTGRAIDVAWDVNGTSVGTSTGPVKFSVGSIAGGTAWGGSTAEVGGFESIFWTQDRYVGKAPSSGTNSLGDFDAAMMESRHSPSEVFYYLTIKLTGASQSSN